MLLNRVGQPYEAKSGKSEIKAEYDRFGLIYATGLVIFLTIAFSQSVDKFADYPLEFCVFFINAGLSIYGQVISIRREASIHFVSFLFCFLFMSAAPIAQLGADIDPVFHIDHFALKAGLSALIFTAIGVFFTRRLAKQHSSVSPDNVFAPSGINYVFTGIITTAVTIIALALFKDGLFTSREGFGFTLMNIFGDQSTASFMSNFLMSTPFFGAAIGLRCAISNKRKIWIVFFGIILLMAAVINNPMINPRFRLAGLAFFFIDYMFYGKRTKMLVLFLVIGISAAPMFHIFRYEAPVAANPSSHDKKLFSETLLAVDYDAYQLSCYTMLTVEKEGILWGSNILGAALFFVPRAWWPGKPPQSSHAIYLTILHYREVGSDNLSNPLMSEGYYAFGWAGVLLVSFLYWWGISKIVKFSWENKDSWMFLLRSVFCGLVFIFLRGTLIVGVAAVGGSFAAAAIPMFLIKIGVKNANQKLPARQVL